VTNWTWRGSYLKWSFQFDHRCSLPVFFGETRSGGTSGWGTVYQLELSGSNWVENVLHSFQIGSDGVIPHFRFDLSN
jgi:hypothetical protein